MAKVYKRAAASPPKSKGGKVPILLAVICAGVGACLANVSSVACFICIAAAVALLAAGVASAAIVSRDENIRLAGEQGETATANFIAQFPEEYKGFQNLTITYDGRQSELDMVVVGPTGVYIIETKNHNGHICGSFENRDWTQFKTGRAGGQYSKDFYNPVKQVGTHVYRLAHYLRERGQNVHVDAMVFFTNPAATVEVFGTPGNIPVYAGQTGANLIYRQILSAKPVLTAQGVENICRLLQNCL